MTLLLAYKMN